LGRRRGLKSRGELMVNVFTTGVIGRVEYIRTCASDANQGKLIAQRARAKSFTRVAIIHEPEAYGVGLADAFATSYATGGAMVTSKTAYVPGQTSYTTLLTTVLADNPQAILLIAYPDEGVQIIKNYNNAFAARGIFWFFTDALEDEAFIDGVGAANFGFMHEGTGPAPPTGAAYDTFKTAFKARFGKDPNPGTFSPHFYDGVYLVALSIAAAGKSDGTSIRDAMTSVSKMGTKYSPSQYATAVADSQGGQGRRLRRSLRRGRSRRDRRGASALRHLEGDGRSDHDHRARHQPLISASSEIL
jgi:ABC-type branched-subunit amino acid transport system substrate-binding protein